jgi:hypothetical protein
MHVRIFLLTFLCADKRIFVYFHARLCMCLCVCAFDLA